MSPDWPPLIIAVAPNGARRTKEDHPALPITPDELAETSAACVEAGASMIHLHVRDASGGHTLDVDAYRAATDAIRTKLGKGIIIQVTSEAVGMYSPAQQMAMVRELRPEAVSMAIRELIPDDEDEDKVGRFFEWAVSEGINVQHILYSSDEVIRFVELRKRGVIPGEHVFVLYVLGRYAKDQLSHPEDLLPFLEATGELKCHWGFCAFGPREGACAMMVTALGGHTRVGFENNRWLNDGAMAPDNAALVRQVADAAKLVGRPIADAAAARELLARAPVGTSPSAGALSELVRPAAGGA